MAQPFYGAATNVGDGVLSRIRVATQLAAGVPAITGWHDVSYFGGAIGVGRNFVDREVFSTGEMLPALEGSYNLEDVTLTHGDFNPADGGQLSLVTGLYGARTTTNPGAGAHYRHVIGVSGNSTLSRLRTVLSDNNTGLIRRHTDCQVKTIELSAQRDDNLRLKTTLARGPFDHWDDGSAITGTSTMPILRNNLVSLMYETADPAIRLKVTDDSPPTVKTTIGSGGAYLGAAIVLTEAGWVYLTDGTVNNAPLGTRSEQVQAYIAATPTWVVDDVFEFTRRESWVQSLPLSRPIAVVQVRLYIDAEQIAADGGFTLTATQANVVTRAGTGVQPVGTLARGNRTYQLTINRQLIDMTAQRKLLKGATLSAEIEMVGDDLIGATAVPYGAVIVLPNLRNSEKTWEPEEGGGNLEETLTLAAHRPASAYTPGLPGISALSLTDACTWVVDTSVTAIT